MPISQTIGRGIGSILGAIRTGGASAASRGRYYPGRYAAQNVRKVVKSPFTTGAQAGINARRVLAGGTPISPTGRMVFGSRRRPGLIRGAMNAGATIGRTLDKKKFLIPFLVGSGAIGTAKGFVGGMMGDDQGYSVLQGAMPRAYTGGNYEAGLPLGYTSPDYEYTLPRNDPLAASGMIALATFKTRHGR
jgi:hypothetical protein